MAKFEVLSPIRSRDIGRNGQFAELKIRFSWFAAVIALRMDSIANQKVYKQKARQMLSDCKPQLQRVRELFGVTDKITAREDPRAKALGNDILTLLLEIEGFD